MKIKNKIFTIMATGVALSALIMPNKSNAALQSNGGTPANKNLDGWMVQIRQMQEMGGTLGRTDSVNTKNLTSGATDLDIHMEKNTEYGAMAILSASAYGNPNKIGKGGTTTGNSTGIVINLNSEKVAAALQDISIFYTTVFGTATARYKNIYSSQENEKIGDATLDTKGWHGSTENNWFNHEISVMHRARYGSIFSYSASGAMDDLPRYNSLTPSRACIVVGTGI